MDVTSAYLACFILFLLAIFQICLITGLPFGEFAWGGYHRVLPLKLRISSSFSILIYFVIALVLLSKVSVISVFQSGRGLDNVSLFIAIYFSLGVFLNVISKSKKERFLMTPIALILAVLSWMIYL